MNNKTFQIIRIQQDTPYQQALTLQEEMVAKVVAGETFGALFMCEHAPVYTCGTSTQLNADYIGGNNIPVVQSGRGGRITYHGPGQRVMYPIVNLKQRGRDLKKYICDLQTWLIESLAELGVQAHTDDDVGVWVTTPSGEMKIAAIGVRVRKWVTFHGVALNIHPDMNHFNAIVPCGIQTKGVTSLKELGIEKTMTEVDQILIQKFRQIFQG